MENEKSQIQIDSVEFSNLLSNALTTLAAIKGEAELERWKGQWLGKEGTVRQLFAKLKELSAEQKIQVAQQLNKTKTEIEAAFEGKIKVFEQARLEERLSKEFIDLSLPSHTVGCGRINSITQVERNIYEVLKPFGFRMEYGPEIETEYYCFDSLNIPKHHPARDMQDTFYADTGIDTEDNNKSCVIRTHTTSIQARVLQQGGSPIKVVAFGRAYRNESEDASHQAMFHQFELVWLDKGLTLSNLLALINHILKAVYGKRRKVSFVPKFYPYTEPSIGARIDCSVCNAKGCPACGNSGWVTVGGAGMIHRKVLEEFNYNPEEFSGFAFGLGTSRMAAQLAGFQNIKSLYMNDLPVVKTKSE